MTRIAVVCALPPERNTGMATVDLAAMCVLQRLAPNAEITLYSYGSPGEWGYQEGELPYRHLDICHHAEAYLASDIFIFWGDFIHSRAYWKLDRGMWDERIAALPASERLALMASRYAHYSRYIFLSGERAEKVGSAIVFGSTIITNEAADFLDPAYSANYRHLFGGAAGVFFRDALSAARVSPLRGSAEATLACDCALLLRAEDLKLLEGYASPGVRNGIGIFFGRSSAKIRMLSFARLFGIISGRPVRWVPWFSSRRRLRWLARLFGIKIAPGYTGPGHLLSELASCEFVITDTYHMCVNAWRMGVPAICIGDGAAVQASSLADKKKEIFYEMYGARSLYVFTEDLATPFAILRAVRRVRALCDRPGLTRAIIDTIRGHAAMAERRLAEVVQRLLTRSDDAAAPASPERKLEPAAD